MTASTSTDDDTGARRRRTRRATIIVMVAVGLAGAVVVALQLRATDDRIAESRNIVADDSRWTTGTGSGEALAVIAERLLAEASDAGCGDAPPPVSRCAGLLRSAAWAEVSALLTLRCTQPFVIEVRANARAVIDALDGDGPGLTNVPAIVRC